MEFWLFELAREIIYWQVALAKCERAWYNVRQTEEKEALQ